MGEMLNTSKPKKLNLALISIQTVLLDTIKMAQDRINLNQIQLILKSEHHLPRLLADQGKMEIAFLNIIMNAIEAMTPGAGVLTIHTAHKDDLITVSISDNGKGIATEDIKRLFDPFFTGKQNGMGLGLTSTKNILNSHNAQIEVKSEVGRGTCFSILFKLPE
jgi:signal transduction histidine kinase